MPDLDTDVALGQPSEVTSTFSGSPKAEPAPAPEPSTPKSVRRAALSKALGTEMGGPLADVYEMEEAGARRLATSQLDQKMAEARGIADAQSRYASGMKQRYAAAEPMLSAAPPKFNVTKDTQEGLSGLAVLLPIAGMIIGSKGMMAGTNAMNAMTGALKGYAEGNQQRIDFETKKYEKAMDEWKNQIAQVKASLDRYEKMASLDLNAATAQAKADAISKGYGVIGDLIDQQGLSKTREIVEKIALQTQNAKLSPVFDRQTNQNTFATQAQIAANPERFAPAARASEPAPIKIVKDGKTVYADRSGNPILDKSGAPIVAPDTRTASAETRYSFNVAESMGQAINDLKNVQLLPRDSVLGTFAGLTGADASGLIEGLRNTFARRVTDEDNRLFEQMIGGLEANMARALGGGYASSTSAKNIEAYRAQVAREGDSPVAKAIFLARMRQELDTLADYFEQRPGAGPFVPTVKKYQDLLHKSVPFTVDDVIVARSNVQNLPIGAEGAAQRAAPAAPSAPAQMNTADDVKKAFQAGSITREEATRILKEKFGYQ